MNIIKTEGRGLVRAIMLNHVLYDQEWLEPGQSTEFFVNPRAYKFRQEPKPFTASNTMGAGWLPASYEARGCSVQLPESMEIDGRVVVLPRPKVTKPGHEEVQADNFDLGSREIFSVELPPVEGLTFPVLLQVNVICKTWIYPFAG